jgi:ligand-binding sensor domain-containing protein
MRKPLWLLMAAIPTVLGLGVAAFVVMRAQHSLDRASTSVAQQGAFAVELRKVGRQENPGFEAVNSPATYNSGAFFQGNLYVSGPSGLDIYGASDVSHGNEISLLRSYRVGLDLPPSPLGQIVIGRLRGASAQEFMIATAGAGVLLFSLDARHDGSGSFRQILPSDREARDVTALLPLPTGELLIGTRKRGLLVYRGLSEATTINTFHPALADLPITALAADGSGIWIGTRDRGVRHWHGGQIDTFVARADAIPSAGTLAGLPDNQVDAIAVHNDKVYVGTPLGVEEFVGGRPSRTLARNLFAHALYADDNTLTIGSMDEGILRVSLDLSRRAQGSRVMNEYRENANTAEAFLHSQSGHASEGDLYAILQSGISRMEASGTWTSIRAPGFAPRSVNGLTTSIQPAPLTDGNISALSFDADGGLWVGYFDRGLDVLSPDMKLAAHYEDDRLFCINRIVADPLHHTMAVATANGLVLMNPRADLKSPRQVITRRDGLISDHVTDVAFDGGSMIVATPAGLSFVDRGGIRSLYAFEGLVNNHVYALGVSPLATRDGTASDSEILAGTLGGLSRLRHEAVEQNFTAANSGLKHNWITAIVAAGEPDTWFVGTYGAGVMELGKDGQFASLEGVTRPMEVNPNAMLATKTHIFAGTLGDGLWVWSRASGRWRQISAGLPSENVTAIAEHAGEVYIGTENGLVRIAERLLD